MGTQWHAAGLSGERAGLRYEALASVAGLLGMKVTTEMFGDIRAMEAAALDVWAKRRAVAAKDQR